MRTASKISDGARPLVIRTLYDPAGELLDRHFIQHIQHRTQTQILDSLDLYSLASIEQLPTKPEQQLAS